MAKIQYLTVLAVILTLTGCASALNTAGSGDYGCPGMPTGVLCKTPAAVYKSTHLDPKPTDFDLPINGALSGEAAKSQPMPMANSQAGFVDIQAAAHKFIAGPRPVREPARIARIWIAPWIDKQDNLHLAQTHFTEIKPRTWTVGRQEAISGGGYVIPYKAYEAIGANGEKLRPQEQIRPEPGSPVSPPNTSARTAREVEDLVPPPN